MRRLKNKLVSDIFIQTVRLLIRVQYFINSGSGFVNQGLISGVISGFVNQGLISF